MTKQNGKISRSKIRSDISPSRESENESRNIPDLSILRKSIHTSITGFTQARDVFDTGTEELKQLLSTECDVIYECRVCRNLFRSLANFISHKRVYCRQKFNTSLHAHFINNKYLKDDLKMILQNEQDYQQYLQNKDISRCEKDFPVSNVNKKSTSKDLTSIVERLASKNKNTENLSNSDKDVRLPERLIKFQSISSSGTAVYQNVCSSKQDLQDSIKDQVNELDNMISSHEAVLGPDGILLNADYSPKTVDNVIQISDEDDDNPSTEIVCKICKTKFSTQKTLRFHLKHKHASNRLVFPCPDCSDTFANAWGVYRHLFKVHRKSAAHIRKLRESIQNKAYRLQKSPPERKKVETADKSESISEQHRMDLENQAWMDNLEGDAEVPRCGGCGRRFERRAALSAHRQTCQLRIAAQMRISANSLRRAAARPAPSAPAAPPAPTPPKQPPSPRAPDSEHRIKVPKMDFKTSEQTIEIQIRRDYNKGSNASPGSVLGTGDRGEADKGDKGARFIDKGIINVNNISDNSNIAETVKDCDDAYVIKDESVSPSEPMVIEVGDEEPNSNSGKNITAADSEPIVIDDGELSFEDIKRICHLSGSSGKSPTKDPLARTGIASDRNTEVEATLLAASKALSKLKSSPTNRRRSLLKNSDLEENDSELIPPVVARVSEQKNLKQTSKLPTGSKSVPKMFCKDCNIEFFADVFYKKHMAKHLNGKRFKCKLCHYKSYYKNECISHLRDQHKLSGDSERLGTFVQNLPPAECSTGSPPKELAQENLRDSTETTEVLVILEDEDTNTTPTTVSIPDVPNIKTEEYDTVTEPSPSPSSSVSSVATDGTSKKRGRPKGSFKASKKFRAGSENEKNKRKPSTPVKITDNLIKLQAKVFTEDKNNKEDISDDPSSADKTVASTSNTLKTKPTKNVASSPESKNKTKEETQKKLIDLHTASSTSNAVKRPIRNRVKPLNKDFEYDLSNLMKLEAEAYKESQMTSNVSQKTLLKRKPLLQNESTPVDQQIETEKDVPTQTTPKVPIIKALTPKTSTATPKSFRGALQAASVKAAHQGRARMKVVLAVTTRRDFPPFIRTRTQQNPSPSRTSPPKGPAETTPVKTAKGMKTTVPPITASKTSNRLSLDTSQLKTGTPTPSTSPTLTSPEIPLKSYPAKKPIKKMPKESPPKISTLLVETIKTDPTENHHMAEEILEEFLDSSDTSNSPTKKDYEDENCNTSEIKVESKNLIENCTVKEETDTPAALETSQIPLVKKSVSKENDETGKKVIHFTKSLKRKSPIKKDLMSVKDMKDKLAHFLVVNQVKNASGNLTDIENGQSKSEDSSEKL